MVSIRNHSVLNRRDWLLAKSIMLKIRRDIRISVSMLMHADCEYHFTLKVKNPIDCLVEAFQAKTILTSGTVGLGNLEYREVLDCKISDVPYVEISDDVPLAPIRIELQRGKEDWPISLERELAGPPPRIKKGRPRQKRIPEEGEGNGSTNASREHRQIGSRFGLVAKQVLALAKKLMLDVFLAP
ncbi:hypothetical protein ACFE04_023143 [Oxalis oulophora]